MTETPANGNYVTWRELTLALQPIHDKLDIILTRQAARRDRFRFLVTTMATLFCGAGATVLAVLANQGKL